MTYTLTKSQKRWAILGIGMSAFMAAAEFYVVGTIIPILVERFNTSFAVVQWLVLIYALISAALVLGVAKLGDIYSKKTLFLIGLILFTVSSVFCAIAPTIESLIVFRGLQALGAVLVWALRNAIITEVIPQEEQGWAFGWVSGLSTLGLALGAGLGGLLVSLGGWRLVFWVNLPTGILASIIVALSLPAVTSNTASKRLDIVGLLLLSLTLSCFVLGTTRLQQLGLGDRIEIILISLAAIGLICFLLFESRQTEPLLDVGMLKLSNFSLHLLLFGMIHTVIGILQILFPLFLELVLQYSPQKAGILLTLLPLSSVVVAPIAGSLADRFGERIVSLVGLLLLAVGCLSSSSLNQESSTLGFCIRGTLIELGLTVFVVPVTKIVMTGIQKETLGIASGLLALSRTLGIIIGTSALTTVLSRVTISNTQFSIDANDISLPSETLSRLSKHTFDIATAPVKALTIGIDTTFLAMAFITLMAIALSIFLWWRDRVSSVTT